MRRISIIGFGKIGQAIAANILKKDIHVTAIDTNRFMKEEMCIVLPNMQLTH